MASGFGVHGGPSRCYPFWQNVLACYISHAKHEEASGNVCMSANAQLNNTSTTVDDPGETFNVLDKRMFTTHPPNRHMCQLALEDYYECLHHPRERARVAALQSAYRDKCRHDARTGTATGRLGLAAAVNQDEFSQPPQTEAELRAYGILPGTNKDKGMRDAVKWLPKGEKGDSFI